MIASSASVCCLGCCQPVVTDTAPPRQVQNHTVEATLERLAAALADVDDAELFALVKAANGVPQIAPGLLAWIEHACDWELARRRGHTFRLSSPEEAIDPGEDEVSIAAMFALREMFEPQDDVGAVAKLLDAMRIAMMGGTARH